MPATEAKTPAFYDAAPIHFSVSRTIAATPDEVFAALADAPTWSQWFPSISKSYWTSEPPYGVGSTRAVHTAGVKIEEEFIVWEPGQRWGFTFRATTIPVVRGGAELVELEPDGNATKVTYHMFLDPFPLLGGVTKLARRGVEKGLGDGLRGLDRHLTAAT